MTNNERQGNWTFHGALTDCNHGCSFSSFVFLSVTAAHWWTSTPCLYSDAQTGHMQDFPMMPWLTLDVEIAALWHWGVWLWRQIKWIIAFGGGHKDPGAFFYHVEKNEHRPHSLMLLLHRFVACARLPLRRHRPHVELNYMCSGGDSDLT